MDKTVGYPRAVLFDLLTALLDSWTLWNEVAGSAEAGRRWRAEYLRLTYGCGTYEPYEQLVHDAARATGQAADAAAQLEANWGRLQAWSGAKELLARINPHCKLGVVTNCSRRLGHQAAERLGVRWDVVVTAEEAGCYKPQTRPYLMALEQLGVRACDTAYIAGSGYDLFGTSQVGLRTYWHNRVGLSLPQGAPAPERESPSLDAATPWLQAFNQPISGAST